MPSNERTYITRVGASSPGAGQAAVDVLTDPALAHIVDLVAWPRDGWLTVANSEGSARVPLANPEAPWQVLRGRNPITDENPLHGVPLARALADPSPPNSRNSYPFAGPRLASVFEDPDRSPDLVVVHTPGHYWPERGGHPGEHGSLDAGQSRAPLLLSGPGVTSQGRLDRAARIIDVSPTLAMLAGAPMPTAVGQPLADLCGGGLADYVIGLLWDGANCNDLLEQAATGALPAVARLLDRGCALTGGAVAEFPSVTLTNHTSALTGVGPGRHGILSNVYFDRAIADQVIANDAKTWHRACDQLRPGVQTVFEAVAAARPGIVTACVNEPIDRGAGYSTFGLVRAMASEGGANGLADHLPPAEGDPHATAEWVERDHHYGWSTRVDALGLDQIRKLWADPSGPPALTWWNTTLTDTGHHGGGPYSSESRAALADADRRLGAFLDLLDVANLYDRTTFLLTADHGSEGADPTCRGDWDDALTAAGVRFRDEGYGFLYLDDLDAGPVAPR
ncbi:MAG: alkaline phosphatase family protein [Frankia sp.]